VGVGARLLLPVLVRVLEELGVLAMVVTGAKAWVRMLRVGFSFDHVTVTYF
jgi:hypothetical protein